MSTSNDLVDTLKEALGVSTDLALAEQLGLDRSTVAQWRRRGSLPRTYRAIIEAYEERIDSLTIDLANQISLMSPETSRAKSLAARQQLYGDSRIMFLLRAILSLIPTEELDWPELSPALLGDHRERVLTNVGRVVQEACRELFGRTFCEGEEEYDQLIELLHSDAFSERATLALLEPTLGEHL